MATGLQVFTNHEFGTIRTITSSGQILFCGKDVLQPSATPTRRTLWHVTARES